MIIFNSNKENTYLHSPVNNQFILLHPIIVYLNKLDQKKNGLEQVDKSVKNGIVEIPEIGNVTYEKIKHFIKKYELLKENGYFSTVDLKKRVSGRMTEEVVSASLANSKQIVFEVTDDCNLKCKYCGYGEFYNDFDERKKKNLDINTAKIALKYFSSLKNSNLNNSLELDYNIGFYGGEPLLNIEFVKEIVNYSQTISLEKNKFSYSMTTNGILIKNHIDFLVKYQFRILISLDGDSKNNSYRIFPNGKESHNILINNIDFIRKKYPEYFEKSVNFNAVLHDKNSMEELFSFIKHKYNKIPSVGELNSSGIEPSKIEDYNKTFNSVEKSYKSSSMRKQIEEEMFTALPNLWRVTQTLHRSSGNVYNTFKELKFGRKSENFIPTGTCMPFSRKVFITVNGKILACESIGHQHALGQISGGEISLDIKKITKIYNDHYTKLEKQCYTCFMNKNCVQCVFTLDNPEKCSGYRNKDKFGEYFSRQISEIEDKPETYLKILKNVTVR